jgi:hypothetical protein
MKTKLYNFSLSLLVVTCIMQGAYAQTTDVTLDVSSDPQWSGSGNIGSNNNDYGYISDDLLGNNTKCIGGIFSRNASYSYYADTDLGTLDRTMTLRLAGDFYLDNNNFDGNFYLGYFQSENPNKDTFLGISFVEPTSVSNPFRSWVGTSGHTNGPFLLTQKTLISFDLTWTGAANGSGMLIGTFAGDDVNVSVGAGTATFDAFGLMCGGTSTTDGFRTNNCYFYNLTYSKIATSSLVQNTLNSISIYPNVTADKIYFNNMPENSSIEMLDMSGRILLTKKSSELTGSLSLQGFDNGLYLLKVLQNKTMIQSVKIIKK